MNTRSVSPRSLSAATSARVAWSLEEVPPGPSAVTIGFFDGVHRGHQLLVERARRHAAPRSLRTVAATFDRHPTQVIRPGSEPPLLMTLERRIRTLHEVGADFVLVIPFTVELSELSPQAFVDAVLVRALRTQVVVVGENFRFGHLAAGDASRLSQLGTHRGLEVEVVELLTLDGLQVSSTEIRTHLAAGDVEWAAAALGRPHVVDGVVVPGEGRGRSIGIPTANVEVTSRTQLPANGVYAGHVVVSSDVLQTPRAGAQPGTSSSRPLTSPPAGPGALLGASKDRSLPQDRGSALPPSRTAGPRTDSTRPPGVTSSRPSDLRRFTGRPERTPGLSQSDVSSSGTNLSRAASEDRSELEDISSALPSQAGSSLRLPAVTNIGVRPTFGGETLTLEAHLLDFQGDLYGVQLAVELQHRLREERRFADPKELVSQIRSDIARARDLLGLAP